MVRLEVIVSVIAITEPAEEGVGDTTDTEGDALEGIDENIDGQDDDESDNVAVTLIVDAAVPEALVCLRVDVVDGVLEDVEERVRVAVPGCVALYDVVGADDAVLNEEPDVVPDEKPDSAARKRR